MDEQHVSHNPQETSRQMYIRHGQNYGADTNRMVPKYQKRTGILLCIDGGEQRFLISYFFYSGIFVFLFLSFK